MKIKFTFLSLVLLLTNLVTNAQSWEWVRNEGYSRAENANYTSRDAYGNIFVCGTFYDSLFSGANKLYSHGGKDVFIAKYDSTGTLLWARSGGGSGDDGYSLSCTTDDSGNVYLGTAAMYNATFDTALAICAFNDIIIVKYNANGQFQFLKQIGSNSYDTVTSLDVDKEQNIYFTGYFYNAIYYNSTSITSNGNHDVIIGKLNNKGEIIWLKGVGGASYDNAGGIKVTPSGHLYVTGYYNSMVNFGGTSQTSSGSDDIFIAKYDTSGILEWVKSGHSLGQYDMGFKLDIDEFENIYAIGKFELTVTFDTIIRTSLGNSDVFVCKLDSAGNFIWVKTYGGVLADEGLDIDVLPNTTLFSNTNFYITGYFSGTAYFDNQSISSYGNKDIFVVAENSLTSIKWIKTAGGTGDDLGWSVCSNNAAECYVSGSFINVATFDPLTATAGVSPNLFFGKIRDFTSGISSISFASPLEVFPNPISQGESFMVNPNVVNSDFTVSIFDINGRLIQSDHFKNSNFTTSVTLSDQIENGIYIVKLIGANSSVFTAKLIVE